MVLVYAVEDSHKSHECCFKEAEYNFCNKTGYFAQECFATKFQDESH